LGNCTQRRYLRVELLGVGSVGEKLVLREVEKSL